MFRALLVLALAASTATAQPAMVTLRGSAYERGRTHGETLRESIRNLTVKWKADLAANTGRDADQFIAAFLRDTDFLPAVRKWTPDLLDEVRGIADGAGIPFETALAMQLLDELWSYAAEQRDANHCSTIGIAATRGHPTYVAQNMDIEKFRDGHQAVLRIVPESGAPEQLIFTCAGMIALNGVNEEGLAVVVNTLAELKSSRTGLPVAFVIRGLLARGSEKEALRFLTTVPHASGQNYIIGSKQSVHDFEASAAKVVRHGDSRLVYHTNHALANDDYAGRAGPRPNANSVARLESLERRLRASGPAMDNITRSLRSRDAEHAVCRRLEDSGAVFTFGSTVMILGRKPILQVTAGPPDRGEYVTFRFDR